MRDGEHRHHPSLIVDAIDHPVRPSSSRPASLQLKPKWFAKSARIGSDRFERLEHGRND
jgi:hypothetical protein